MPFITLGSENILFLHVPKAGGTTVEGWMRGLAPLRLHSVGVPAFSRCTPQHYRWQDIRALFGEGFFAYSFALVRNPYARIESEYRMRAAEAGRGFWKAWPTFPMWLDQVLDPAKPDPWKLDNHLRPQWEFIGSGVEVFRLEDGMEKALARVAARLGVPAPTGLPREMSSAASPATVTWDRADRLRVQEHYRRDFEEFGYDR